MMKTVTNWLVRKSIPRSDQINDPDVRVRYGWLEAVVSIVVNLVLFVVKLVPGVMLHSVSLIADAVHTLTDSGTSIVILIGFRAARLPADREHPFGHGRAESIAALIVAVILVVTGVELLKSSAVRIFNPAIAAGKIGWLVVLILFGTIVVKELTARFAAELGKMIQSKTLEADAWHHRSDALSTLLVLAAMLASHFGYNRVDGVAGVAVALIVIYSGYMIARDAISPLLGERPSREMVYKIEDLARSVDGVWGVHDVIVHHYGQLRLISLHIEVDEKEPASRLHDISDHVEDLLEKHLGAGAVVHIDPLNVRHRRYGEVYQAIRRVVAETEVIHGFHELRLSGDSGRVRAAFDITLNEKTPRKDTGRIISIMKRQLSAELAGITFSIKAEPRYAYSPDSSRKE